MAETSQQPQGGIAYPLALGSTFDGHDSQEYLTMRIDFIPASADRTAEGSLHLDPETHTVRQAQFSFKMTMPWRQAFPPQLPILFLTFNFYSLL